jgi:hypothetical protein
MFKKIAKKLFSKDDTRTEEGFFLNVRCSNCGEEFNLFINKSWELIQNFQADGSVSYALRKEIFGVGCNRRIKVEMDFDSAKNLLSRRIEDGVFIDG